MNKSKLVIVMSIFKRDASKASLFGVTLIRLLGMYQSGVMRFASVASCNVGSEFPASVFMNGIP